jgi:integrase
MATLYKDPRTGNYILNWIEPNGKRRRESTLTKDPKAAKTALNALSAKLDTARIQELPSVRALKGPTFREFVQEEYLPAMAPPARKPLTWAGKKEYAAKLMPFFGDLYLSKIGTWDILRFLDGLKASGFARGGKVRFYAPATLNRYRAFLCGVMTEAKRRGFLKENPVLETKSLSEDNERVRYLSDLEEVRLLQACETWLRPILRFAIATGMRRGEILALTRNDVDLESRRIKVSHTKSKRTRFVRLRKSAEEAIAAADLVVDEAGKVVPWIFADPLTGRPWARWKVRHGFERAVRKAGIENLRFHDARHTLGTRLYRETRDLQAVQKVLGHSDITTAARYAHVVQADLDAAMDALDGADVTVASTVVASEATG